MRVFIFAIASLIISGCSDKTPSCTDVVVQVQVTDYVVAAIKQSLLQNDPDTHVEQVMSNSNLMLENITTTDYDNGIDKHSCRADLRLTLPPGVAALKDHHVFQSLPIAKLDIAVQGDDIVSPITYTTYRSEKENQLIVRTGNENTAAKYIQGVHKIDAFDTELRALPDLHLGLTLYSTIDKNILIEPEKNGSLKFRVDYQHPVCRSWKQSITGEIGDTLIYENRAVGCSVTFSRLGEIMLVEHEGCEMMVRNCYPDGIYRKQ